MAAPLQESSMPPHYYDQGSVEIAGETPVVRARLEKRQEMTGNSERLLVVMVGLPARGKSFLSRKLVNYLTWRGNKCQVFNVGRYRRQAANGEQHADFFDDTNQAAARIRQKAAELALKDTLEWLEEESPDEDRSYASGSLFIGHTSHSSRRQTQRIAIFDATNSTRERRKWILQQCDQASEASGKETGVVFVESICNDKELLAENYHVKITSSPDFENMSNEEALADLQARIAKYEARYETVDDDTQSYIKVFNLSSKLMVNHVYGRIAKVIVPALMAWNVGSRPIFLCRSGETSTVMPRMMRQDDRMSSDLSTHGHITKRQRGDRLTERGLKFRDALCDFVEQEGMKFMTKNTNVVHPRKFDTGTSRSGLREHRRDEPLFPCLVMSSTMPRALETSQWEKLPFPIKDVSNLNPLDMGDFAGMSLEAIRNTNPEWYNELEQEPFHTRFPGGESYSDLINRLESVIIDVEQQLGPAVVVSHVSVLQVLMSYFRSTPVTECTGIEIPMHTVLKFTPLRGGGWMETHHNLSPNEGLPLTMSMPQIRGGGLGKMDSSSTWCCTASLQGEHINTNFITKNENDRMETLDLTQAVDWMQFIEDSEGRRDDRGGAGAYDTLRCDITHDQVIVWGLDYHLDRLQASYRSLLGENATGASQIESAIQIARAASVRMINIMLQQAQNALTVRLDEEEGSAAVRLVRFTWLWSPPKATTANGSMGDIAVRAHAVCSGEPVIMPPKPKPITCTIAVGGQIASEGHSVIVDSHLPSRFADPQSKIASWTRQRKALQKPETYKPPGVEEVILVRQVGGMGAVELLEGLSSNLFVLYNDGSLHTPADGVLYGYVRHLVLESAKTCGLTVSFDPILLEDVSKWKEAFITSSSRLIFPISKMLLCQNDSFVDFWKDPLMTASSSNGKTGDQRPKWKELLDEVLRKGGYSL